MPLIELFAKSLRAAYQRRWRAANSKKHAAYNKRWYAANREKKVADSKCYQAANAEKIATCKKRYRLANLPDRAASSAKHRAAKLQATPSWAEPELIELIYAEAAYRNMQVDHIIPLQGKNVCGLHVHNNMQLLTRSQNASKGNRH